MSLDILRGKTYFVRTFGCQMNMHDSERVAGLLNSCGCLEAVSPEEADIVVFMTCCVREAADTRMYGQCASLKSAPVPAGGKRVIAIGGCIAQRDGEELLKHVDNVNVIFGTAAIASCAELIAQAFESDELQINTNEQIDNPATNMPWSRQVPHQAWIPIMTGCNNFCSYCIVPYVRGREKSRDFDEIVTEVRLLAESGVREVCLLGQNVNSYGRDSFGKPRFADLLRAVGQTGIERIRFTSSHPKDLLPETIKAMSETEAVMPQLHLAVQSGSTRVLKEMNRRYTRESYLKLIDDVRNVMPDIALSTDIIVGFPTETEEDFLQTLSMAEQVKYSQAFTFIYSKRKGTPAAEWENVSTHEQIQDRFDRLVKVIQDSAWQNNQKELNTRVQVLVEGTSKRDTHILTGKSPKNQTVHAPIPEGIEPSSLIGKMVDVDVDTAKTWYLSGTIAGEAY